MRLDNKEQRTKSRLSPVDRRGDCTRVSRKHPQGVARFEVDPRVEVLHRDRRCNRDVVHEVEVISDRLASRDVIQIEGRTSRRVLHYPDRVDRDRLVRRCDDDLPCGGREGSY